MLIALATLRPLSDTDTQFTLCLICGERGTADAIANIILFLPLGYALGRRWSSLLTLAVPALISVGVELAQIGIPGRNPSLGDVLFNGLGGIAGIVLARGASCWWRRDPGMARIRSVAALASVTLPLVLTAWFVAPDPSDAVYWGQWTPEFKGLERYEGRIIRASVGPEALSSGPLPLSVSANIRAQILHGATITAMGVAGRAPGSIAPVLSAADAGARQIFLIGLDRADVVFRYRTRALGWRLNEFILRAPGLAADLREGDSLHLTVRQTRGGVSLALNARHMILRAPSIGAGWRLISEPRAVPAWLSKPLDGVWLAILVGLAVFLAGGMRGAFLVVALASALLAFLPVVSWLAPTPLYCYAGALIGALVAMMIQRTIRRDVAAPLPTWWQRPASPDRVGR